MSLLQNLAIWYLRKTKSSVLMNLKIEGDTTFLTRSQFIYDSTIDGKTFLPNGTQIEIPEGYFKRELTVDGKLIREKLGH